MSLMSNLADEIPGLLKAALIFKGVTPSGRTASIAVLIDGDKEVMLDLNEGLNASAPDLTQPMRSYVSGLSQVGQVLETRKIEDEDGVTEDDLERAALTLAFPRAAQNPDALSVLKLHLDALQDNGVLPKAKSRAVSARPEATAETTKTEAKETVATTAPAATAAKAEAPKAPPAAPPAPPAVSAEKPEKAVTAVAPKDAVKEDAKINAAESTDAPKPATDKPFVSAPEKVDLLADPSEDDESTDAPKPLSAEDFKRARELTNGARKPTFFGR